ncbi:hypothetical protein V2I01_30620 [Micromonospora sp. BRA006-A]|nr:hypothetical protein [Micromonospora sp. BRA006-A]
MLEVPVGGGGAGLAGAADPDRVERDRRGGGRRRDHRARLLGAARAAAGALRRRCGGVAGTGGGHLPGSRPGRGPHRHGRRGGHGRRRAVRRHAAPQPADVTTLTSAAGQLWAAGMAVDWAAYLGQTGTRPRAVELPTYAFDRQRYWLEDPQPGSAPERADAPSDEQFWAAVESGDLGVLGEDLAVGADEPSTALLPKLARWRATQQQAVVDSWRYRATWRTAAVPDSATLAGTWLLLMAPGQEDHPVAAALAARADRAVPVLIPAGADRDRVARLLLEAMSSDARDAHVVSLLSLAEPREASPVPAAAEVSTALAVVQALTDVGGSGRLWWLTRGAVSVGGSDELADVAGSAVWGLGRVVGLEVPLRWGWFGGFAGCVGWWCVGLVVWGVVVGG